MDHVKWESDARYENIISEVSKEHLWKNIQKIASYQRESGLEGERQALDYIQGVLKSYDISTQLLGFDAFIGLPEDGEIAILPRRDIIIRGRPPAFSAQTPQEGVEAEVVYVGRGKAEELDRTDIRGKFALVDGLASPHLSRAIEDRGAIGHICISGENIVNMIVTSIWGTPTPETAWRIPRSYVLSIVRQDGDRIKEALKKGPVRAIMKVRSFVGWKKIPILLAHIEGRVEPQRYAMLTGHIDSWHYGATDNGTANAAMMETARIMRLHKDRLRRSLKVAFWSGHSQGRYAGSAWFADNFWEDLYRNCVGVINVDMVGCMGSTVHTEFPRLGVTKACGARAVLEVTGQRGEGAPFGRSGDQSFWGVGLPTLFGVMSRSAGEQSESAASLKELLGHGGLPWWWHTVHDTIDKVDPEVMAKDTRVIALAACYFCSNSVLPLDFVDAGQEILGLLEEFKKQSGGRVSLDGTIQNARAFLKSAEAFHSAISGVSFRSQKKIDLINRTLTALGRILIPVVQTAVSTFDHDLALPMKRMPAFQPVAALAAMDENSNAARFLKTRLIRERNRVDHALLTARDIAEEALKEIRRS
jgi:hypothetical protein